LAVTVKGAGVTVTPALVLLLPMSFGSPA